MGGRSGLAVGSTRLRCVSGGRHNRVVHGTLHSFLRRQNLVPPNEPLEEKLSGLLYMLTPVCSARVNGNKWKQPSLEGIDCGLENTAICCYATNDNSVPPVGG